VLCTSAPPNRCPYCCSEHAHLATLAHHQQVKSGACASSDRDTPTSPPSPPNNPHLLLGARPPHHPLLLAHCSLEHAHLTPLAPRQVKSGAFASRDRDAALARMIEAASYRYVADQEQGLLQDPAAAQSGGEGGPQGLARLSASLMRKISLSSVSTGDVHVHVSLLPLHVLGGWGLCVDGCLCMRARSSARGGGGVCVLCGWSGAGNAAQPIRGAVGGGGIGAGLAVAASLMRKISLSSVSTGGAHVCVPLLPLHVLGGACVAAMRALCCCW
jgi:hypothetical protein